MVHLIEDAVSVGSLVECVFHCLEIVVVDESSHADTKFIKTIGREVGGAVAVLVLQIKVRAAVAAPGSVGSSDSLAQAVNTGFVTVRVEACGDAKEGFDVVHCVF